MDTASGETKTNGAAKAPIGASGEVMDNASVYTPETMTTPRSSEMKTETKILVDIQEADLDRMLNAGWEKWHAEFKGNVLNVVLTRPKAKTPPTPEQPSVAMSATPPAEPALTGDIIGIDNEPETPEEEMVTAHRRGGAVAVISQLNAEVYCRVQNYTALRPVRVFTPLIGIHGL